jgi:hypothetical protein
MGYDIYTMDSRSRVVTGKYAERSWPAGAEIARREAEEKHPGTTSIIVSQEALAKLPRPGHPAVGYDVMTMDTWTGVATKLVASMPTLNGANQESLRYARQHPEAEIAVFPRDVYAKPVETDSK